jgi:hypothetical protein
MHQTGLLGEGLWPARREPLALIHAVKADRGATFRGRKLTGNVTAELGGDFSTEEPLAASR